MNVSLAACFILLIQFPFEWRGATALAGPDHYVNPADPLTPTGIKLTSSTDVIEPALTRDFYIMCSTPKPAELGLAAITSMVISKGESTNNLKEIASINIIHPLDVKGLVSLGAKLSGKLDLQHQTFIRLDWTYPSEDIAGLYRCAVSTLDSQGHPVTLATTIRVNSKTPDMQNLVNQFRIITKQQEDQIREMNVTISNMQEQLWKQNVVANVTSLRDRVQVLELFDISAVSAGKQYLVSRIGDVNISTAEALCHEANGHLADIRSSAELDAITTFMKTLASTTQFDMTYFSPTQENHPGHWVYRHSGEVMTYTGVWDSDNPDNYPGLDCATLSQDNWKAANFDCGGLSDANFICERASAP